MWLYHPLTAAIVHSGTWTNGNQRISVHDDVRLHGHISSVTWSHVTTGARACLGVRVCYAYESLSGMCNTRRVPVPNFIRES